MITPPGATKSNLSTLNKSHFFNFLHVLPLIGFPPLATSSFSPGQCRRLVKEIVVPYSASLSLPERVDPAPLHRISFLFIRDRYPLAQKKTTLLSPGALVGNWSAQGSFALFNTFVIFFAESLLCTRSFDNSKLALLLLQFSSTPMSTKKTDISFSGVCTLPSNSSSLLPPFL